MNVNMVQKKKEYLPLWSVHFSLTFFPNKYFKPPHDQLNPMEIWSYDLTALLRDSPESFGFNIWFLGGFLLLIFILKIKDIRIICYFLIQ